LAIVLGVALLSAGSARAQDEDIDTQRFQPRVTSGGYFQTEGSAVRGPIDPFSLGLWLSYAHNPLVAIEDDEVIEQIVSDQLAFDLTASYSLAEWFELGVHLPLAYLAGDDVSDATLGDARLLPKFRLLHDEIDGVGLALLADVRLPTHTSQFYGGARMPAFAPRLIIDHRFGLSGFRAGVDLGVLLREQTQFRNVSAASEFQGGLGVGYRFDGGQSPVEIMLDLRSAIGLAASDPEETALETLLGASIDVTPEWKMNVGGGLGILEGFGIPTARVFVGLRWEPSPNDPDHDGLRSPTVEEDEHKVLEQPPPSEQTGEPVPTQEQADAVDDATREAAIRGGYDACPRLPEDLDGIEDEDGCPEGDEDGDGVLDYLDRCPDEAETINGYKDDDGCEDEGPAQIIVEEGRISILETIRFESESSAIDRSSYSIMDQIALALRKHKEIERIEVGGHTDSTGSHDYNVRLSHARARSVRTYLIEQGIKPGRLSARGYGPDKPIADNETDEGRSKNRRVEFVVLH
jgi:outer membrane protein OmpA-like peptidoglycan-associated protein